MVGNNAFDPLGSAQLLEPAMLARGVSTEAVDRNHRRYPELADVGEVAGEIAEALFKGRDVFLA